MDWSFIDIDDVSQKITIGTDDLDQTMEALDFLVDEHYINPNDYDCALFTSDEQNGASLEISSESSKVNYRTIVICAIDFNRLDIANHDYKQADYAMKIIRLFNLEVLGSIEHFIRKPNNYFISKKEYKFCIKKDGVLYWKTRSNGSRCN